MAPSEGSGCLHTQEERQTASEAACKQYSVTPPLSKAKPTEADIRRTKELEKFLEEARIYESTEDASKREVLDCLRQNGSSRIREEGHNQSRGIEQVMLNIHAYLQYGFHTTQQKPAIGINLVNLLSSNANSFASGVRYDHSKRGRIHQNLGIRFRWSSQSEM